MAYPKIVYDAGAGPVTLNFTYPNVDKPGPEDGTSDERGGVRTDSISLSGKKQVFYIRTDKFRTLTMKNVPMTDLPAWAAFMDWAVTGGKFSYYPDSSLGASTDYTLEDTNWTPAFVVIGITSFKLKMRQFV